MARLIYSAIASLDGYVADEQGKWDWSMPDEEVHAFVNDLQRPVGTHLYGRRMYEVLSAWETMDDPHPQMRDYAEIWRAADKVVYSTTLEGVASNRTRLERDFEPIGMMASAPFILVVHPSLPARSLKEFVALARSRPGPQSRRSASHRRW